MADGTSRPIVRRGFGVSIVCDAKQNPWNDNVRDAPQRVRRIVDVSSVLTPVQLVPSGEDNQFLLNQYASWESYNMIY
jgi:hypothetical protein